MVSSKLGNRDKNEENNTTTEVLEPEGMVDVDLEINEPQKCEGKLMFKRYVIANYIINAVIL